jgi:hypothetical protein
MLWGDGGVIAASILGLNIFNLVAGYLAVVLLSGRTLAIRGRSKDTTALFGLPIYWLMMSVACVRALFQLIVRPHHWEKTTHQARQRQAARPRATDASPTSLSSARSRSPAPR